MKVSKRCMVSVLAREAAPGRRESWQVGGKLELQASLSSSTRGRRPASGSGQPMARGKVGPGKRLERGLDYFYGLTFNNS